MLPIKIKLDYGTAAGVADLTLSVYHWAQQQGQMYELLPGATEQTLWLAPGDYRLELVYDRQQAQEWQTCVIQRDFNSGTVKRLKLVLNKPQQYYQPFSAAELAEIQRILRHTINGNINVSATQVTATQLIKQLSPLSSLTENVVIDKNGKVGYRWSYQSQASEEVDETAVETAVATEPTVEGASKKAVLSPESRRWLHQVANQLHLQPVNSSVTNLGTWESGRYGTNVNLGAVQNGYRCLQAGAYLRPRTELLQRLYAFIQECRHIAYVINGLELD
jgi:hypothetical protein